MTRRKVVRTDLGEKEYEMLSAVARDEGLTIKEAARKALVEWSVSALDIREDPLFRLKPVRFKAVGRRKMREASETMDRLRESTKLSGWSGVKEIRKWRGAGKKS